MQNYENLIYDKLPGDSPKDKYEYLEKMQTLLQQVVFPRRGTKEENMTLQDFASLGQEFMNIEDS